MSFKNLSIGTKIEIKPIRKNIISSNEFVNVKYYSQVLDMTDDDTIIISMPVNKGKIVLLSDSYIYELSYHTKGGIFKCQAKIIDRYKSNNLFLLVMELITPFAKFQRREFYRLDCAIPIQYLCLESEMLVNTDIYTLLKENKKREDGMFVDISGGGARFITNEKLTTGNFIILLFSLHSNGKDKLFHILGQVIASVNLENKRGQFENRCKFVDMIKEDREAIIKFIFEEERRKRKK